MKDVIKNLKSDENIIAVIKKYFLVVIKDILISILLFTAAFVLLYFILKLKNNEVFNGIAYGFFGVLLTASIICFIRIMYIWKHDSLIITNQRIFDITQKGIFDRHVAEINLSDIKSVSYTKNGLIQTLFNFGDLRIDIQNEESNLSIIGIKDPADIQQLINDRKEKYTKEDQEKNKLENLSEEEAIGFAYKLKEKLSKETIDKIFKD